MNLLEIRFEIKRIKDKKSELLIEKENIQRDLCLENSTKLRMIQEIENKLKIVVERLEKALKKEKELNEARERDIELER
jgi:hypothetical protein